MLDVTPKGLREELTAGKEARDKFLATLKEMVQDYHGSAYRDNNGGITKTQPENHAYEYLSLTVPRIVFNNPAVSVKSKRGRKGRMVAQAIELAMARWIREADLRRKLVRLAYDQSFAYGAALTCQYPKPGLEPRDHNAPHLPVVHRLSPRQFMFDPVCLSFESARWVSHCYPMDRDELKNKIQTKGDKPDPFPWIKGVIEALANGKGVDEYRKDLGFDNQKSPRRNEILIEEVWVPEADTSKWGGPEKGYNGMIYTLAGGTDDDFVREPRPYYGPRTGPYTMFGVYPVLDSPWPLAPLAATRGQAIELNAHAAAASRSMAQYKRVIITGNEELSARLQASPDNWVFTVPGLTKDDAQVFEVGGLNAQTVGMLQLLQDRLQRVSGITDAMKGNPNPGNTATADAIADEANSGRMAFIQQGFVDGTRQILSTVAEHLWRDDRVVLALGEDAEQMLEIPDPMFRGGKSSQDGGMTFEDLELDIDPYSMPHVSDQLQQAKAMQQLQIAGQFAPIMPQTPWIKWDQLFDKTGQAMNDSEFGEVIDQQALNQARQQMQQGQLMQGLQTMAQGIKTTPRMAKMNGGGGAKGGGGAPQSYGFPGGGGMTGNHKSMKGQQAGMGVKVA